MDSFANLYQNLKKSSHLVIFCEFFGKENKIKNIHRLMEKNVQRTLCTGWTIGDKYLAVFNKQSVMQPKYGILCSQKYLVEYLISNNENII